MSSKYAGDPADSFCELWDTHQGTWSIDQLETWTESPRFQRWRNDLSSVIDETGAIPEDVAADVTDSFWAFLLAAAIDDALEACHPDRRDSSHPTRLSKIRDRYLETGILNSPAVDGALLFRRAEPASNGGSRPDHVRRWFRNLRRLSPNEWAEVKILPVPIKHELVEAVREQKRRLRVGCLALLDDLEQFEISIHGPTENDRGETVSRYRIGPRKSRVTRQLLEDALQQLDRSSVDIALLPESTLDKELLTMWQAVLEETPLASGSPLRWLVVGTGHIGGLKRRNRAVVLHRVTGEILLEHDKTARYTIDNPTSEEWGIDAYLQGSDKYLEDIAPGRLIHALEGDAGRFVVMICEALGQVLREGARLEPLGPTHVLVPVFDRELTTERWERFDAMTWAEEIGCAAVVSNSLAVARHRRALDKPEAPTAGPIPASLSQPVLDSSPGKPTSMRADGPLTVMVHEV